MTPDVVIGRDSCGVVGKNMEKLVGISDARIAKNNRLFLLVQGHGRWMEKKAMVANAEMEGDRGKLDALAPWVSVVWRFLVF